MRAHGCTVDMPQLLLFTDVPGTPVHRGGEGSLLALLQPAQVEFARAPLKLTCSFIYLSAIHLVGTLVALASPGLALDRGTWSTNSCFVGPQQCRVDNWEETRLKRRKELNREERE